jgi:hypothetical protein
MKSVSDDPSVPAACEGADSKTVLTGPGLNKKLQTLDRRLVDGDPLDEWTATVMRNMKRMGTDEAYRLSIAKYLS